MKEILSQEALFEIEEEESCDMVKINRYFMDQMNNGLIGFRVQTLSKIIIATSYN